MNDDDNDDDFNDKDAREQVRRGHV